MPKSEIFSNNSKHTALYSEFVLYFLNLWTVIVFDARWPDCDGILKPRPNKKHCEAARWRESDIFHQTLFQITPHLCYKNNELTNFTGSISLPVDFSSGIFPDVLLDVAFFLFFKEKSSGIVTRFSLKFSECDYWALLIEIREPVWHILVRMENKGSKCTVWEG